MAINPTGDIGLSESPEALEARRAQEEHDAELDTKYENPSVLRGEMDEVNRSLYGGAFVAPEETAEADEVQAEEIPAAPDIMEHPDTPFITRLQVDGVITNEVATDIETSLQGNTDFAEVIEWNEEISSQVSELIISRHGDLNNPETTEAAQADFTSDFEGELKTFQDGAGNFESERTEEVIAMIGEAYLTPGSEDVDEAQRQAALNMAVETATNRVLAEHGQTLTRNVMFEVANQDVRNPDLSFEERVTALTDIMNLTYNQVGAKGWRRALDRRMTQQRQALQAAWLEQRFEEAQIALQTARAAEDVQAQRVAQAQYDEVMEAARETMSAWDIWAFDTAMEVWWIETRETSRETA